MRDEAILRTFCTFTYLKTSGHYMYRTVVTIFTAQWSLYVPHSVHYIYSQWSLYVPPVITICTAQWSLYVPHSGHYMYRQWSLYVPTVVSICTASFNPAILRSAYTVYLLVCVLCGSQNKQPLLVFPYTTLTDCFV